MFLPGHIHRYEDGVRVTAQLLNTRTGTPIWATQLDESADQLLKLEETSIEPACVGTSAALDDRRTRTHGASGDIQSRSAQILFRKAAGTGLPIRRKR